MDAQSSARYRYIRICRARDTHITNAVSDHAHRRVVSLGEVLEELIMPDITKIRSHSRS
jgi:hypothetical protein